MFQRIHYQHIIKRVREKRKLIQVIMGPRQVGKTTLITQIIEGLNIPSYFISADAVPASNTGWLQSQWEAARSMMVQKEHTELLLVIDEIQKVNNWSETVKLLWDMDTREKRNLKVILLGSSRLLLQQGLTESLAGRFETTYMGHWSFEEMRSAFGWTADQYAWFGGYPGSADLVNDEKRWKDYVLHSLIETSISKDILMLSRVDKPALMKQLFELGCIYSGQELSYTKVMGQLTDAGNTTTLSHYLQLLDTAGLLCGLEKYAKDVIRKRSSSPKFQVHNTALISAQQGGFFDEVRARPVLWGRIVESAVGAHLLNHSHSQSYNLYYWREGNHEVDFVLEWKKKIIGIEVKSGSIQKAKGMDEFRKKFNPEQVLIIGDSGIRWQEFLEMNPIKLFTP